MMNMPRRRFLRPAALIAAVIFAPPYDSAWPQTGRPVKMIMPYPPGGGGDFLARLFSEQIGRTQRLTVVVENRPGAGTVIGTEHASRAAPDGNTVLMVDNSFVIRPHLQRLNYDPLTSFEPICNLVHFIPVIAVNSESPYRTLTDLINAARTRPGELTLASNGPGSSNHLAIEMFKHAVNVDLTYIPFSGAATTVNALLGQHVTSVLLGYPGVAEQIKAGRLRALATTLRARTEPLAEVPTVAELGYKDYVVDSWWGAFAPAKTPNDAISRLSGWFTAALQAPDLRSKLAVQGLFPVGTCGTEFATSLRKEYDEWGRVVHEANMKKE